MIDGIEGYPSYRDSNIAWAPRLPAHWQVKRGKTLFSECHAPVRADHEIITCFRDGQVTLRRNRRTSGFMIALQEAGYQGVRTGQLVIHAMDAFAGAIGISDSEGKCTPEYIVCEPRNADVCPPFFSAALRLAAQTNFIQVSCAAVRERAPRFRYPTFGDMLLPAPPLDEQAAIVRFLDHADRRIRRYIASKQKLIKLLEEQKQAIIHRAVTRGLDTNVQLKPSGADWLGDVPEHWEVKRLKWVTNLQRGYDLPADQRRPGPFPVVSSGGKIGTHSQFRSKGPGVVIGRYGSTNAVFYIEEDFWPHNTSLFVTDFYGNSKKWCHALHKIIGKGSMAEKSAVPGIDRKDLFQIMVSVPPFAEQELIVEALAVELDTVDAALGVAQAEIALLREYRTRLFSDVVTGKLDVRAAAAALPDELDEAPELLDDEEENGEEGLDTTEDDE